MTNKNLFAPNKITADVVHEIEEDLAVLNNSYSLPARYLRVILALHLPKFSRERLYLEKNVVNRKMVLEEAERLAKWLRVRIDSLPASFKKLVQGEERETKVVHAYGEVYEVDSNGQQTKLRFGEVDSKTGKLIQENLHYIGCSRRDTIFEYGFYREDCSYPIAYLAISHLNRKYLLEALPFEAQISDLLVLTRMYAVNSCPHNALSLLLSLSVAHIKNKESTVQYTGLLTAVNPNVFFIGSAFKASNFHPFATVVFEPLYSEGNYITRRSCQRKFGTEVRQTLLSAHGLTASQIPCAPTVWMGHGMDNGYLRQLEINKTIRSVSSEKYRGG
ncbi:hypothetical protein KJ596_03345 [Patescibacteria group bacterium]|nr:hypothetical protein [Patescibacteria group bacterium]MBU1867924.1 hypothetical protein [Patescibacteria group bacterium]